MLDFFLLLFDSMFFLFFLAEWDGEEAEHKYNKKSHSDTARLLHKTYKYLTRASFYSSTRIVASQSGELSILFTEFRPLWLTEPTLRSGFSHSQVLHTYRSSGREKKGKADLVFIVVCGEKWAAQCQSSTVWRKTFIFIRFCLRFLSAGRALVIGVASERWWERQRMCQ